MAMIHSILFVIHQCARDARLNANAPAYPNPSDVGNSSPIDLSPSVLNDTAYPHPLKREVLRLLPYT